MRFNKLDRNIFLWIAACCHLTTNQLRSEIGRDGSCDHRDFALSRAELLLLDRICRERASVSLDWLIQSYELIFSPKEVAEYIGCSTPVARKLMLAFAADNAVPATDPEIFIWRRDIGSILFNSPLTRHLARNPIWLYRRDNKLGVNAASAKWGISKHRLALIEAGIERPTREELKQFGADFKCKYDRWWKKNKRLVASP